MKKYIIGSLSVLLLTALISSCEELQINTTPAILSNFDTDDEGWTVNADATEFGHELSGGNPGGYIRATDLSGGDYWYYVAPDDYLGDQESFYGGELSFDIFINATSSLRRQSDIIIEGNSETLTYEFDTYPEETWTAFSVVVAANEGWQLQSGGTASETEIRSVLQNIVSLQIRGEYRFGGDNSGLDNVRWVSNQ